VVACADGDTLGVENSADIVRMSTFEHEGKYPRFVLGSANDLQALDLGNCVGGVVEKLSFVFVDCLYAVPG